MTRVDALTSVSILFAQAVGPHVDDWHPEWSALWVMQASGHGLGMADHRPKRRGGVVRRRPLRSRSVIQPVAGQIVLLNLHRTHWLDRAQDGSLFIVAVFDFDTRPERAEVEEYIRHAVGMQTMVGHE